jgi:hypothetical protein
VPLAIFFFVTALLYSAVGFGGGSTYNALLVLGGVDYRAVPVIALMCNIIVVTVAGLRFGFDGHVDLRRIWPLFTFSVPLAWVGGRLVVPEILFVGLLSVSLLGAGLAMLIQRPAAEVERPWRATLAEASIGGALGFLAGIVGIGGGIFLAPILTLIRWGNAKAIAGTCAIFILVNSISGLFGQLSKTDGFDRLAALEAHWALFPAVLLGGLGGSALGSRKLRIEHVRIATACLVLYVAIRLGARFIELAGGAA